MPQDRPFSPVDGTWVKDDFVGNDAVGDATVGEFRWELTTLGNASTLALQTAALNGVLRITTNNTADGDGCLLRSSTDGLAFGHHGGGFTARVRHVTALTSNFRIGVDDSVTTTDPTVGIWVRSDAGVLTLEADSNSNGDHSQAVSGVSTLTGGTTMEVDRWYDLRCEWTGQNGVGGPRRVELFVDGEPAADIVCNIGSTESAELKIIHWQDTGIGAARIMDIDYFEFWQWRS